MRREAIVPGAAVQPGAEPQEQSLEPLEPFFREAGAGPGAVNASSSAQWRGPLDLGVNAATTGFLDRV